MYSRTASTVAGVQISNRAANKLTATKLAAICRPIIYLMPKRVCERVDRADMVVVGVCRCLILKRELVQITSLNMLVLNTANCFRLRALSLSLFPLLQCDQTYSLC